MKSNHINDSKENLTRRFFLTNATAGAWAIFAMKSSSVFASETSSLPELPGITSVEKLTLGMIVYDGFQLLDTFGPLEMFGHLQDKVSIVMIGTKEGKIKSNAGPSVVPDYTLKNVPKLDILMIPGGATNEVLINPSIIKAIKTITESVPQIATVCNGSEILAKTGLLDGLQATTNKQGFKWITERNKNVKWIAKARWVEDGKYLTSSGISAGMDMALALISKLYGNDTALRVANSAEYRWNSVPQDDPFAALNGLVD